MYYPFGLLKKRLEEQNLWGNYTAYTRKLFKISAARLRIRFLNQCLQNDVIPRFLKFRIPDNGCFESTIVHNFQRRLLRREQAQARKVLTQHENELGDLRKALFGLPGNWLVSVGWYARHAVRENHSRIADRHSKKLSDLSLQQKKPLRSNERTVVVLMKSN